MFRTFLSVSVALMLAGAGFNLTAGTGQAASRGGGHGGGGHGGGFHGGGFHGGGGHFGGFHGGSHFGGSYGGFRAGSLSGFHSNAYNRSFSHAARYNSGIFGEVPYFLYSNPTYPNSADTGYGYGPVAGGSDEESALGYYPEIDNGSAVIPVPSTAPPDAPADITMTLPAGATLWAMGKQVRGSGTTRELQSPTLAAGHRYAYDFRASWNENGQTVTQDQTVFVTPGEHLNVRFPAPATKTRTAPSR